MSRIARHVQEDADEMGRGARRVPIQLPAKCTPTSCLQVAAASSKLHCRSQNLGVVRRLKQARTKKAP